MKKAKMNDAMQHLDDDLILSAMKEREQEEQNRGRILERSYNKMKKTNVWMKWAGLAAVLALAVLVGALTLPSVFAGEGTVIAFDVNPSIEIEINKNEKVLDVDALNADAEIVLGEMDLEGLDLETALNAIVGSMVKNGYISAEQNSILISVKAKNSNIATALKEKLSGEIDTLLGENNILASVMVQEYQKNKENDKYAEEYKISPAKAELISKIVAAELLDANGVPYTYEVLAALRVHDLKMILESKGLTVGGVISSGTPGKGGCISVEEALAKAYEKAGITEDFDIASITPRYEMDYDKSHGVMVYEVEFIFEGNDYEYEIHAKTGDILEEEIEPVTAEDDDDEDDEPVILPENGKTREEALAIAYADAGVTAADARRPEIEVDMENGICVYEIEFRTAYKRYEYTINAATGEIIDSEVKDKGQQAGKQ